MVWSIFKSLNFLVVSFLVSDVESEDTKSESESESEEEEQEVVIKGKSNNELSDQSPDPDDEEAQLPGPALDGERIKGKYTLRKIQPIDRYCPIGIIILYLSALLFLTLICL